MGFVDDLYIIYRFFWEKEGEDKIFEMRILPVRVYC